MYAFRDRYAKEWGIDLKVDYCPPISAIDPTLPPAARSRVRASYRRQAQSGRWLLLDGERDKDTVAADISDAIASRLSLP
jgi:hypothetical protein